jgi:chromate reductase, NAD(P)H dehydrogenase (quinone)
MSTRQIAVLTGSLRKDSITLQLAKALESLAPDSLAFTFVEIGDLPHYNEDLETATPPESWTRFREVIKAADAVLVVSPEYNRGVPGALKNAIDVGSRPWGKAVWAGKPAAVVTASPGALGGYGVNHHIRQILNVFGMPVLPMEVYISGLGQIFAEDGSIAKDDTRKFLSDVVSRFADWVAKHS